MNSQEAINALFEGKYVRQPHWDEDQYIYLDQGAFPNYAKSCSYKPADHLLFQKNDWEILEYQYQWLCYDVKKKEYYLSDYIVGEMNYALGETKYKVIKRLDETKRGLK